ncbi:alpha/beta fold hydrolase [Pseudoprimorskyibacter insulae]|uniref:3-oxoadipate enol-lactonase 2 n=1 Tax=Pseudoprimorskyibacter insulae TaxID=1695997 RepID=A0A2R8AQ52_9RHOB|nr:alpha/beta hydrolase [Pseudoprimorskyibacter insulae]SPF78162.1 3-oxoadipate enol-lactonase 2 [Pseudoprimorskyibacter insulae]
MAMGLALSLTWFDTEDGARLAYRLRPGAGPVVAFAHPHTGDMGSFDALLDLWDGPALVWDRRSYGASGRGAGGPAQADDLCALLDHLRLDRLHLIGIAAGGAVAAALVIHHPDRVAGLGLACSFIGQPHDFWCAATGEARPEGDAAARELSPAFRETDQGKRWAEKAAHLRLSGAGEPPQPCPVDLAQLAACTSVHLATGQNDLLFTPVMLAHAAHLLPMASAQVLPNVAHAPHVEDPAGFARWVQNVVSRG